MRFIGPGAATLHGSDIRFHPLIIVAANVGEEGKILWGDGQLCQRLHRNGAG